MGNGVVPLERRRLEQSISKIGAKVADAGELANRAKELTSKSEALLIRIQQELEELYLSLDQGNG